MTVDASLVTSATAAAFNPKAGKKKRKRSLMDKLYACARRVKYSAQEACCKHVGIFLRVPEPLASEFPSRSPHDDSPPHATLLYVGDCTEQQLADVEKAARENLEWTEPFEVEVCDYGEFQNDEGQTIAHMVPKALGKNARLSEIHDGLRWSMESFGIPVQHVFGFKPHVTLAYLPEGAVYKGPKPRGRFKVEALEIWCDGRPPVVIPLRERRPGGPVGYAVPRPRRANSLLRRLARYSRALYSANFDESKHPRADDGKFTSGPGGGGTSKDEPKKKTAVKTDKKPAPKAKGKGKAKKIDIPARQGPVNVGEQTSIRTYVGKDLKKLFAGKSVYNGVPTKNITAVHQFDESEGGVAELIDRKGQRPRYNYTDAHNAKKAAAKFSRIGRLRSNIEDFRDSYAADMAFGKGDAKKKAIAAALIDHSAIRMGGDSASKRTGSVGVSTLRAEHLSFKGGSAILDFPAKSGKQWLVKVSDPDMVAALREVSAGKKPGESLLGLDKDSINGYLKEKSFGSTAKDFRTYHGTRVAQEHLKNAKIEGVGKARDKAVKAAVRGAYKAASEFLKNTPSVAKDAYVDPAVIAEFKRRSGQ